MILTYLLQFVDGLLSAPGKKAEAKMKPWIAAQVDGHHIVIINIDSGLKADHIVQAFRKYSKK